MKRLWAGLLCLASVGAAAAADALDEYAYAVPIEGIAGDALYRVAIPRVVHEATAFADLRDLRVFNGTGEVVPHAFRPLEKASERPAPVALQFYALRGARDARPDDLDLALENKAGRVSLRVRSRQTTGGHRALLGYVIDASPVKAPLSGLGLDWVGGGDSYFAAVRVEASDDLKHWAALASDAQLVRLARAGQKVERKTIEYRPRRAKYLRLVWIDPARVVELKTVRGFQPERGIQPERVWKRVVATPDAGRSGEYRIDVGGAFPLDRLAPRLPQENSVAPIEIFSRASTADAWMPVVRAVVYRLTQNGTELASKEVSLAPNAHRYWLLRVDERGGGIGRGPLIVRAGWIPREIVFAARGEGPFSIAYGNARARANALAIETLVPGWRTDDEPKLPAAATGAPREIAGEAAARQHFDVKKWSLWAALFAGVAVLGWMAWRLTRQMNRSPEDRA